MSLNTIVMVPLRCSCSIGNAGSTVAKAATRSIDVPRPSNDAVPMTVARAFANAAPCSETTVMLVAPSRS